MKWSPQQEAALKAVAEWMRWGAPQVFHAVSEDLVSNLPRSL